MCGLQKPGSSVESCISGSRVQGVLWTPSKVIARLGKEIACEESVLYWAWKVMAQKKPKKKPKNPKKTIGFVFSFFFQRGLGVRQNSIPVFCPALTDGSLGDMMYFHSFKNPGLVLDIISGRKGVTWQPVIG